MLVVAEAVPVQPIADVFGSFAITASAEEVANGTCGTDVTWSLDDEGVLTVSGTGAINNKAFRVNSDIKSVVIQSGVTGIGENSFEYCENLESINIPDRVSKHSLW